MLKRIITYLILLIIFTFKIYGQVSSVHKAQAMFIYNFSRLIQWPEEYRTGKFIIGIIGDYEIYNQLKSYTSSKKVAFQDIEVKKFKTPAEITKCHIIFISYSKASILTSIKQKVSSYATLIISEKKGALNEGAAINFIITGSKLQFELKESNASNQGLILSTRLKNMASNVY